MPAISSHRRPSAILWLSVAVALMSGVLANESVSSTTLAFGSAQFRSVQPQPQLYHRQECRMQKFGFVAQKSLPCGEWIHCV